jgi:hypothetical protein
MKSWPQVVFLLRFCFLFAFSLSGCKKSLTKVYPIEKNIVDVENRQLMVSIEGKSSTKVAFRRKSDQKLFVLPIEKLDATSRAFVEKLPNSSDFSPFEKEEKAALKRAKMQGRTAVWHRSYPNALREAAQYDIPVVVAFLDSQDSQNQSFSTKVLESKAFRDWANENVVLCLFYKTPENVGLNGIGSQEGHKMATTLGISTTPGVAIVNSKGDVINKPKVDRSMSPEALIQRLTASISSPKPIRSSKTTGK